LLRWVLGLVCSVLDSAAADGERGALIGTINRLADWSGVSCKGTTPEGPRSFSSASLCRPGPFLRISLIEYKLQAQEPRWVNQAANEYLLSASRLSS